MSMLFTWNTNNLCIIFSGWHIHSTATLIFSLLGVVLLTAGYELVRDASRRYESSSAEYMNSLPSKCAKIPVLVARPAMSHGLSLPSQGDGDQERSSLLWSGKSARETETKVKFIKAALYAVQVFYSFFIM
ncbi:MAG: hypothetical protein Q9195_001119 [Heterodermia aff. obscurata]